MTPTRWLKIIDKFARQSHRELRITFAKPLAPKQWLFVVGCYNSGTTLIAEVLGKHPSISELPGEGQFLTDQLLLDYMIGLPRMWVEREDLFRMNEHSKGPDVGRIKKEWSIRASHRNAPIVLEKTPANMARTRWLQANFANAYFIGVIRDPYAVSAGIRKKAEPEHRVNGWPIEMCARQWARSNEVLEEDSAHLKHFMWLRYEEFAEQTNACLERVASFLGIDPFPAASIATQNWNIHERDDAIRNLNAESLADLTHADLATITQSIGPSIKHFGYSPMSSSQQ